MYDHGPEGTEGVVITKQFFVDRVPLESASQPMIVHDQTPQVGKRKK
jgi:hypothetical protein